MSQKLGSAPFTTAEFHVYKPKTEGFPTSEINTVEPTNGFV